jgi:hypothetical protein
LHFLPFPNVFLFVQPSQIARVIFMTQLSTLSPFANKSLRINIYLLLKSRTKERRDAPQLFVLIGLLVVGLCTFQILFDRDDPNVRNKKVTVGRARGRQRLILTMLLVRSGRLAMGGGGASSSISELAA